MQSHDHNWSLSLTWIQYYVLYQVLQLTLTEEVMPDASEAKRSLTTGHLLVKMPKVCHDRSMFEVSFLLKIIWNFATDSAFWELLFKYDHVLFIIWSISIHNTDFSLLKNLIVLGQQFWY